MIPLDDLAVGADDGCAEVVGDESTFRFDGEREKTGDLGQVSGTGSGEFPAAENRRIVRVGHGEAVVAQNLGRVVLRVEADAQEARTTQPRIRTELLIDFREVAAHSRAEIGKRAARVNEGEEQDVSAVLLQRNPFAGLIGERKIRYIVARSWHVQRVSRRRRSRSDMAKDSDIFQPVVRRRVLFAGIGLHDHHIRGNRITGKQVVQGCGRLELVGHGHGLHEAGNGVAINDGGLRLAVDRNHAAGKGIAFSSRRFRSVA